MGGGGGGGGGAGWSLSFLTKVSRTLQSSKDLQKKKTFYG